MNNYKWCHHQWDRLEVEGAMHTCRLLAGHEEQHECMACNETDGNQEHQ